MSKSIKLSSAVKYSSKRINVDEISVEDFISTDNLLQNKLGKENAIKLPALKGLMPGYSNENILIGNIRPYLKKIWFADKESGCSADVLVLDVNKFHYPKFIYYTLFRDDFFDHMMKGSKGTKMPRGDKKQILDFLIPDFEFEDQQKIAKVLSDLDSKIEINNRINTELEAMAKTLYDYWFVQFDFPYVTSSAVEKPYKTSGGKMVWNDELKREIPEGWEVNKIGEISMIKAGGDKPKVLSNKQTKTHSIPIYSNGITNEGLYGYTDEAKIDSQSITISARGTIGFCVLRNKPFVPIIRLIVIIPNDSYSIKYFHETIKNIAFEKSGSVQQQLTVPQISHIDILNPPVGLLKKFDKATSSNINKIELIKEENQELASLRNWLLPMLMNGQVSVGDVLEEKLGMVAEPTEIYKK